MQPETPANAEVRNFVFESLDTLDPEGPLSPLQEIGVLLSSHNYETAFRLCTQLEHKEVTAVVSTALQIAWDIELEGSPEKLTECIGAFSSAIEKGSLSSAGTFHAAICGLLVAAREVLDGALNDQVVERLIWLEKLPAVADTKDPRFISLVQKVQEEMEMAIKRWIRATPRSLDHRHYPNLPAARRVAAAIHKDGIWRRGGSQTQVSQIVTGTVLYGILACVGYPKLFQVALAENESPEPPEDSSAS